MTNCSVSGCNRVAVARGWCTAHYARWLKTGETGSGRIRYRPKVREQCTIEGCAEPHEARGFCKGHYYVARRKTDGEKIRAREREAYKTRTPEQRERKNAAKRRYYAETESTRVRVIDTVRRWKYGVVPGTYETLFATQGGVCAICGRTEARLGPQGRPFSLSIDHDHGTGTVRGLLCSACNFLIGHGDDDPERLEAAAAYLRRHRIKVVA